MQSQPFSSVFLAPLTLKTPNGTMARWHVTGRVYCFSPDHTICNRKSHKNPLNYLVVSDFFRTFVPDFTPDPFGIKNGSRWTVRDAYSNDFTSPRHSPNRTMTNCSLSGISQATTGCTSPYARGIIAGRQSSSRHNNQTPQGIFSLAGFISLLIINSLIMTSLEEAHEGLL